MNSVEINSDMPDPLWWLRRSSADVSSRLSRHVIEPNYLCDRPVDCVYCLLASRGPDGDTQQADCGLRAVLFRGLTYTLSGKS